MTERLFLAIFPPDAVCDSLIDEMEDWPGIGWQGEDQLHLTLRFLGNVDKPTRGALIEELASIHFSPFEIMLERGDAFRRKGRARSIHRLVRANEPLMRLARSVDRRCEVAGFARRERRFLPHITLARLGSGAPDTERYIASLDGLTGPAFAVDRFTLVASHLSHSGAIYEPLVDFLAD